MESIEGQALVAAPNLMDPNFLRSVVYILRHDEEGAVGLVLNRPTNVSLDKALSLADAQFDNTETVFSGGPVPGPLMMMRGMEGVSGEVAGVRFDAEPDNIVEFYQSSETRELARLFTGYSGWGAGQLESELKVGGWLVWDVNPKQVFSDPEALWKLAIREIGRDILSGGIDPALIPEDPAFN